ncbi:MAG: glycosyl hydrolase [Prolixibacteraceae bacterium]|nr:glycosyl hydrolase [Prolixibacteraceae bacterium]
MSKIFLLIIALAIGTQFVFSKGLNRFETSNTSDQLIITESQLSIDTLCTPDASPEAVALFRYIQDMYGKKMLSGQMWAPWGIDELKYLQDLTGKQPAMRGMDYIHEGDNNAETQRAIDWWKAGGIPTIMWHWGAPGIGEGYENSKKRIDINQCFIEGTPEYISMWSELKIKADHLEKLRDANVPVLWRPFHELNGGWFWWGMQGSDLFEKLWITMYDYFVKERELNNLIWVLCYTGSPDGAWNPGSEYFDIAGPDTYGVGDDPQLRMFNQVKNILKNDATPIAYHECGTPPNPDECLTTGAMWSWWMVWHTNHLTDSDPEYIKYVYNHDLVITRDEVPDIKEFYSWTNECTPSEIITKIQLSDSTLLETNSVMIGSSDSILLITETTENGTWQWSGLGTSGNGITQKIGADKIGTVTATFTNHCGAITTATFNIKGEQICEPTTIVPYLQVDGGSWTETGTTTITNGSSIKFGPHPTEGGTWKWSGTGVTNNTREITITPDASCKITATYTNDCGTKSTYDFMVTVKNRTNISTLNTNDELVAVYPDPFNEFISIAFNNNLDNNKSEVKIYTLEGKIVHHQNISSKHSNINTSALKAGMYVISIKNNDIEIHKKLMKTTHF